MIFKKADLTGSAFFIAQRLKRMKCFVPQSSVNVLRSRENLYEIKFGMISALFVLVQASVDYPNNIYLSRLSPFTNIYVKYMLQATIKND
ncbi:hypothetical protein SS06_21370 [Enterobacter roggenkampii]|nr:hypothetical protein SS06_21370 [Enterobacter roggenkampii]